MKKLICLMLCMILVLTLVACGESDAAASGETTAAAASGGLMVGYSRLDITPKVSVPLAGYGNTSERMSNGYQTFLYTTCIAYSDGEDTILVFQNDLSDTIAKYDIIQNARMYRQGIAIAPVGHTVGRVTAAQAADELLNIAGISASFVLYPDEGRVILSARSLNETNVQVIVEALGGGGNGNAAGAQLPGKTVDEVYQMLLVAIDNYFDGDEEEPDTI